jgi:hypothetical protein
MISDLCDLRDLAVKKYLGSWAPFSSELSCLVCPLDEVCGRQDILQIDTP